MLAAPRRAPELLESAVETALDGAVPTLMPLCDPEVCVAESAGREGGLVTLCPASTGGGVEAAVLGGVLRSCVDGVWVKGTESGELESRRVVFWSKWHTVGSWVSERGAEKVSWDPGAGSHTVSAALEGKPTN